MKYEFVWRRCTCEAVRGVRGDEAFRTACWGQYRCATSILDEERETQPGGLRCGGCRATLPDLSRSYCAPSGEFAS